LPADHDEDPLPARVGMARFVHQIQFAAAHLFGKVLVSQNVSSLAVQAVRVPVEDACILAVATAFCRSIKIHSGSLFQKSRPVWIHPVDFFQQLAWKCDGCLDFHTTNLPPFTSVRPYALALEGHGSSGVGNHDERFSHAELAGLRRKIVQVF